MDSSNPSTVASKRQIPDVLDHVGSGWSQILMDLHAQLVQETPDYSVGQVKEKFGDLRVYLDSDWNGKHDEFIMEAERRAAETCEACGAPGQIRTNRRWYLTLCDDHAEHRPTGDALIMPDTGIDFTDDLGERTTT